jgi:PAS domain S-box-containing protein
MKGHIPEGMLPTVLDELPAELTLIDAEDKIIAWTEPAYKIFHRSDEILGTDVRDCHPEKSQERVNQLLEDLKSGKIDTDKMIVPCKDEKTGEPITVLVQYIAVRSPEGEYLGCMEVCRLVDGD